MFSRSAIDRKLKQSVTLQRSHLLGKFLWAVVSILLSYSRRGYRLVRSRWLRPWRAKLSGWYFTATEGSRLKKLMNIRSGDRCFLLGSGPSINEMNLTKLKNEFTFCLNAFILHEYINAIDPKCYISCNPVFLKSDFFETMVIPYLRDKPQMIKVFDYDFSKPCKEKIDKLENVFFMKFRQGNRLLHMDNMSFDVTRELPRSDTTVLIQAAIPLAVFMGFKEIYLVGCDCNYAPSWNKANHFYKEAKEPLLMKVKEEARSLYGNYWRRHNHHDLTNREYGIAKRCLERSGIRIMNAGIGGKLDVFERVAYEDLFFTKGREPR